MSREQNIEASKQTNSAQLSENDLHLQINLRLHLDEIAEVEAKQLLIDNRLLPTRHELCQLACRIYDARRSRDRIFDRELFGEPAWDTLLALYCLPARGEIMTVSALALASATSQTTGYRWQAILTQQGLIERGPQGVDLRKQFMRLTAKGRALMESYLTRLFYCDTPVPPHPEAAGG